DDRPAHTARRCQIARVWRVEGVKVPGWRALPSQVRAEPGADALLLIPVMHHAGISHTIAVPAPARIAREHVEPHDVHIEICSRMFTQDLVLHPTGAAAALGSSR